MERHCRNIKYSMEKQINKIVCLNFAAVPVLDVIPRTTNIIFQDVANKLIIDLEIKIRADWKTSINGQDLWKVGVWGTSHYGQRIEGKFTSYVEQVRCDVFRLQTK